MMLVTESKEVVKLFCLFVCLVFFVFVWGEGGKHQQQQQHQESLKFTKTETFLAQAPPMIGYATDYLLVHWESVNISVIKKQV